MLLSFPADAPQIFRHLAAGGLIAYPTESIYGIGGWAHSTEALQRLQALKPRATEKRFLTLAAQWAQISAWVTPEVNAPAMSERATTYLYPASDRAPEALCWDGKIAIRLSAMPFLQKLCAVAPLLSTSANPHAQPAARTATEVKMYFPEIWVIDENTGGEALPSRIIDWQTGHILRH